MSKKDEFKLFVKNHPELVKYVNNNQMTWQKFYDMYILYGNNNEVWNDYLNKNQQGNNQESNKTDKVTLNEIISMIKRVDADSLQKNINNINKGLALIESLVSKDSTNTTYNPRPLYKKFED